jgi:hypothetical protein
MKVEKGNLEIVLRRGGERRQRIMEGVNPTKIYFNHM